MSTVGAAGSAAGHSANTAGWPSAAAPVSQISVTGKPVVRNWAASHSADFRTSSRRAGSAEIDGMASHSFRSAKKALAFSSTYVRASMGQL
jgi:hypothetical protein